MKTSQRYETLRMPKRTCLQVKHELDTPYCSPQIATDRHWAHFHTMSYLEKFCTLESSTISFSPSHGSPNSYLEDNTSGSCVTEDDANNLRHKLKELETVMLGPEPESEPEAAALAPLGLGPDSLKDLKQVLIDAARAVSDNNLDMAQWLMNLLRGMVSVSGEPIQRLGAYMLEGLVARLASSGSSIYRALKFKEPETADLMSYMHILYEACPYFKFGYMSANGAIAEAMKDEKTVHIIDFEIAQGSQWVTLIQAFAARPGGPPRIRITGLEGPTINGGLEAVSRRLEKLAKSFNVPFEFIPVRISGSNVGVQDLDVRPGEAVAVNFAFVLHHMEDESVSTENHRDRILRMVKSLEPKVVTLVEQESNTNTAPFYPRFVETLNYYAAMFESIDMTLSREHKERINVEQQCLARAVVNIIACEGPERVERHELLGKWRLRFTMAGFRPNPLSPIVNGTIKSLLDKYSNKYRVEERDGALYLGWMDRDLVASSAWR